MAIIYGTTVGATGADLLLKEPKKSLVERFGHSNDAHREITNIGSDSESNTEISPLHRKTRSWSASSSDSPYDIHEDDLIDEQGGDINVDQWIEKEETKYIVNEANNKSVCKRYKPRSDLSKSTVIDDDLGWIDADFLADFNSPSTFKLESEEYANHRQNENPNDNLESNEESADSDEEKLGFACFFGNSSDDDDDAFANFDDGETTDEEFYPVAYKTPITPLHSRIDSSSGLTQKLAKYLRLELSTKKNKNSRSPSIIMEETIVSSDAKPPLLGTWDCNGPKSTEIINGTCTSTVMAVQPASNPKKSPKLSTSFENATTFDEIIDTTNLLHSSPSDKQSAKADADAIDSFSDWSRFDKIPIGQYRRHQNSRYRVPREELLRGEWYVLNHKSKIRRKQKNLVKSLSRDQQCLQNIQNDRSHKAKRQRKKRQRRELELELQCMFDEADEEQSSGLCDLEKTLSADMLWCDQIVSNSNQHELSLLLDMI